MKNLLKEYIQLVLKEAAASPVGYALQIGPDNRLTLWDPNALLALVKKHADEGMYPALLDKVDEWVVGTILLGREEKEDHWGGREVMNSAARKGFGPTMYDLAMYQFGCPLFSDRDSVSPSAENVWDFYMKKRSDIKRLPFDDIENPKTPSREDDAEVYPENRPALNAAYNGTGINTTPMLNKHKFAVKLIADELGWESERIQKLVSNAGREFFQIKYEG